MEFIEAMKIKKRMCEDDVGDCIDCPLSDSNNKTKETCDNVMMLYPEGAEKILSKWAEDHPQKTIRMDFLEKYPNAPLKKNGLPKICLVELGFYDGFCPFLEAATDCKECWNRPLED